MSWITEQPIAHRGLHSEGVPENSVAAFRAAAEEGYAVELDVRTTSDGVPVVYHDEDLSRLTARNEAVSDMTWDEISGTRIEDTDETVPRFDDALRAVGGEVPILVELKNEGPHGELESAVVDRLDGYEGEFAVQSFNPYSVSAVRAERPGWLRGQLSCSFEDSSLPLYRRAVLKRLLMNWKSRPDFVAYRHTDLPYLPVSLCREAGLPVLAWTVQSEEELQRARIHADNVIFEKVRP